jgi:hypothetical protein
MQQMHAAWDRIARTEDGRTLYLHFAAAFDGDFDRGLRWCVAAGSGRTHVRGETDRPHGKGIRESGGRTSTDGSGGTGPEQPIVFAVAGPRAVSRAPRRRPPYHRRHPRPRMDDPSDD